MDYARPLSHTTIRPKKLGDSDSSVKIMFLFVPSTDSKCPGHAGDDHCQSQTNSVQCARVDQYRLMRPISSSEVHSVFM